MKEDFGNTNISKQIGDNEMHSGQRDAQFVELNRALIAAETPGEIALAAKSIFCFLDELEKALQNENLVKTLSQSELAKIASMLLTILAMAGQYRHDSYLATDDKRKARRKEIDDVILPQMGKVRQRTIQVAKLYFSQKFYAPLRVDIELEILPLLDSMDPDVAPQRFMPFRVIQIGNIFERLYALRERTNDPYLKGSEATKGLLRETYDRKYLRFGTSGVRGEWDKDFTEKRAKQVAQAICDYLKNKEVPNYISAEDLSGKRIVVGYDSRRHATLVAQWVTEVCLANGFTVDLANRDTPTPVLVYYMTDYLNPGTDEEPGEVAGLINCTASHNPPEWQGIKFNPRLGYPAPTNVTDFIAIRINELQILDQPIPPVDLEKAKQQGQINGFDPITYYTEWILNSGKNNERLALNWERIREYFVDKLVVVDEMHGAGRGYLPRLLGEIGVRHTVLHAECDPSLPGLDYANPEEPFINPLKEKVKELSATIGLGLDTDADRFGIVDKGGMYYRPNQMLPMLIQYLGVDRKETGRVIATQTGSPLIDHIAGKVLENRNNEPESGVIPAYVDHPYYQLVIGKSADRVCKHAFLVPVGIKYIEEQRRTDRKYGFLKPLPEGWRDTILIGGEESSGLTTRGHVTDKDGIWADLLILDMLAYYGTREANINSIGKIWQRLTAMDYCWPSYGGYESENSNRGREDVDAILEVKEDFINGYLDMFADGKAADNKTYAGLEIVYLGGIRYDIAELQLRDSKGDDRHYLRVRASGTEPINRIYVESSDPDVARLLMESALERLEELSIRQIQTAHSEYHLVNMLVTTRYTEKTKAVVKAYVSQKSRWTISSIIEKLKSALPILDRRNKRLANAWIDALN